MGVLGGRPRLEVRRQRFGRTTIRPCTVLLRAAPSTVMLPGVLRPIQRAAEGPKDCVGTHGVHWFEDPQTDLSRLAYLRLASVWVSQHPHSNHFCTAFKAPLRSQKSRLGNPGLWKPADTFHICLARDTCGQQGKDDGKLDPNVCSGGPGMGGLLQLWRR